MGDHQAGKSWSQVVKNSAKDGRSYWVTANVSPIIENGSITGYISVRKPVSAEVVAKTAQAYREINNGNLFIDAGHLHTKRQHQLQAINPFKKLKLIGKINVLGLILLMIGVLITGIITQQSYNQSIHQNESSRHDYSHDYLYPAGAN